MAVVSCDNLTDNGAVTATVVKTFAAALDPGLVDWIDENVSFVTTMVDRITPASSPDDAQAAADLTGHSDAAPVVTEPFSEWVLSGDFPGGRPAWDARGARFVDDIGPFEERKLWLLNGGHSLLAYAGSARGHDTIAQAVNDPICRDWMLQWWSEASAHLTLPASDVAAYRDALVDRFANPRIRHLLAQIASDGSLKLPVRILPVVRRGASGGPPTRGRAAGDRRLDQSPAWVRRSGQGPGRGAIHRSRERPSAAGSPRRSGAAGRCIERRRRTGCGGCRSVLGPGQTVS